MTKAARCLNIFVRDRERIALNFIKEQFDITLMQDVRVRTKLGIPGAQSLCDMYYWPVDSTFLSRFLRLTSKIRHSDIAIKNVLL